jgi:hypothetical protein
MTRAAVLSQNRQDSTLINRLVVFGLGKCAGARTQQQDGNQYSPHSCFLPERDDRRPLLAQTCVILLFTEIIHLPEVREPTPESVPKTITQMKTIRYPDVRL